MRNLSKVIDDEIKYDMANKFNKIIVELAYQIGSHHQFLEEKEQDKIIIFIENLGLVIERLRGGLWEI